MHDWENRTQKERPERPRSDESVKTAQRKLAGGDGGAGMSGQNKLKVTC